MKKLSSLLTITIFILVTGCTKMENTFLDKKPTNILLTNQVWSDPNLVLSVVADLYDRIPEYQELQQYWNFTDFDDAFPSNYGDYWRVQNQTYGYNNWSLWNYNYIRDINLFILDCKNADQLDSTDRNRFLGEGEFLRATAYFDLVKRMGGVPLILDTMVYNFSSGNNTSYWQHPRAPEAAIYDFVMNECDSAAALLPNDPSEKTRATWGAAMALKCRAALYAGSIAKYGAATPSVSLPGNIVGIPADQASHYYQIALNTAQQIINSHEYGLYLKYPDDLSKNFYELFLDKNNNPEVIFAKDYKLKARTTQFTVQNQPHSLTEEGAVSGFLNPSLNLVQSFERLDNTFAPFAAKDASGNYIEYNDIGDIFKDRDARLAGSVILPGSQFRGENVDIWAGYILPQQNWSVVSGSTFGAQGTLPGQSTPTQVVGFDGPLSSQIEHGTQTGFYIRKYLDPTVGAGEIGTGSDVWWIRYRYAEVLLNAAEASFELGQNTMAASYMNQVRARAGLIIPLKASDITFDRIVHERRVEFAFEGLRFWDMKRWRLAHVVWNGEKTTLSAQPGNVSEPSTRMWGLWPYKIYDPGQTDNGQWVFRQVIPGPVTQAHQFRLGNYYSQIDPNIIAANPKLIQNPNQ